MSEPKTEAKRDGLHCVYGKCRGLPCSPHCSFTMTAADPLEAWRRLLVADAAKNFHPTMGDARDGERYRWLKANPSLLSIHPNNALWLDAFIDAEIAKVKA